MKRNLIMVERIMYVDAVTPLNCVFTAKIKGSISPGNLRSALFKVQQKHPSLRAGISDEYSDQPCFVFNNEIAEVPVRIVERLTDNDWLTVSKEEWYKLFNEVSKPLARVVWLRSVEISELMLILPHCICDGGTIVALMREILSLLDEPDQELKAYSPFVSIHELMPDKFHDNKKMERKSRIFAFLGRIFFYFKPTRNRSAKDHYVLHWKLDTEQTINITKASKKANASVHGALCAAFLNAFQEVRGNKAHGKVISPVDIRHFIPQIKQDTMFAFAPIVELNIDKKSGLDFWSTVRKIKAELTTKIEALNVFEMLWMGEYMHASVKRMVKFLKATDGTHDVTLSNMGKLNIPETYKSFELEAIYSPTVAFPWRNPSTLVASTFKNQMDFTFVSNNVFLPEADALKIKNKTMQLLFDNL
ncbi:hypothetical protein [Mucilaginibacter sp.]|uniref:phthiocerol/phthiodiolone dimycocerosyl transferase family protein n=1 Tax=Mucilaginibacter sp. TaxID=1882438 RepID=UPI002609F6A7|nr:hypothetical protein [Mucilaginibacter sp.]